MCPAFLFEWFSWWSIMSNQQCWWLLATIQQCNNWPVMTCSWPALFTSSPSSHCLPHLGHLGAHTQLVVWAGIVMIVLRMNGTWFNTWISLALSQYPHNSCISLSCVFQKFLIICGVNVTSVVSISKYEIRSKYVSSRTIIKKHSRRTIWFTFSHSCAEQLVMIQVASCC